MKLLPIQGSPKMFKVGDIITGIDDTYYGVTNSQGTFEVMSDVNDYGEFTVKVLTHSYAMHIGFTGEIEPQHFKLVTPAKPKLETLIKRIKLGRKATQDLIEHYNDNVEIAETDLLTTHSPNTYFGNGIDVEIIFITEGE